jgi:UDP-glucose 4-epimerase
MRVLVCGGAGYIGSNMTVMLEANGHEPIIFDNLSRGHNAAVSNAEFIKGDLSDFELLVKTLKQRRIDAVMHFAAFIEVGESVQKPLKYYYNNVCNTQNLLSAMEATGVDKFIFSSSAAVYGTPEKVPITENSQTKPINPYGETKLTIEKMCHYQSEAGKLRYAALRYFNACGAGNGCRLGEDHRPESHLIPLTIKAAMGKCSDVKIYGTDYPTPDGTCIRDYIHIEDLCRAHLLALDKLEEATELIYNLGSNKGYSVKEVIETVRKISGKNFKITQAGRRAGDSPILTADAMKAIKELGWKIRYPKLEKIVETAWEWHNKYPNGYPE